MEMSADRCQDESLMSSFVLGSSPLLSSCHFFLMLSTYASSSNFVFLFLMIPSHLTFDVQFQHSTSIINVPLILPRNSAIETLYWHLSFLNLFEPGTIFGPTRIVYVTFVKISTSYPRYLLTGTVYYNIFHPGFSPYTRISRGTVDFHFQ